MPQSGTTDIQMNAGQIDMAEGNLAADQLDQDQLEVVQSVFLRAFAQIRLTFDEDTQGGVMGPQSASTSPQKSRVQTADDRRKRQAKLALDHLLLKNARKRVAQDSLANQQAEEKARITLSM